MIQHILFPTDLSGASQAAIKQVMTLATTFHARLTLFHASELSSSSIAGITYLAALEAEMEQKSAQDLAESTQQFKAAGGDCEWLVSRGTARPLIVATAENLVCDLIFMFSRGLGPVRSLLMGSTSTYLLHHSALPMMVIPAHQDATV